MKIILKHGERAKMSFRFSCLCGCVFLAGEEDYTIKRSRTNPDKTIYVSTCPECEREGLVGMLVRQKEDTDVE